MCIFYCFSLSPLVKVVFEGYIFSHSISAICVRRSVDVHYVTTGEAGENVKPRLFFWLIGWLDYIAVSSKLGNVGGGEETEWGRCEGGRRKKLDFREMKPCAH